MSIRTACRGHDRTPKGVKLRRRFTEGNITELAIWQVPRTRRRAAHVRYRLAFIRCGEAAPAVLYDNHVPKGDHRHREGVEEPYEFRGVDQLIADFTADVQRLTGEPSWPRRR